MLKNIRLHIEKDEEKQAVLDESLATTMIKTHKDNINAFQRSIPSLLPYVQSPNLSNYSLFNNKYGETNIVDYGLGRTFYGFHPQQEVLQQLASFQEHCPEIVFDDQKQITKNTQDDLSSLSSIQDLEQVKIKQAQTGLPKEVECLVVLGCGLGLHLQPLLEQHKIKNLIIYEPELQYFQCSIMATAWQDILALCKEKGTAIFLQLEKDGRDVVENINELRKHASISSFRVYKHYNHQVFNSLYSNLCSRSWQDIEDGGLSIHSKAEYLDYIPHWTTDIALPSYSLMSPTDKKYKNNLKAFQKYFPDIHEQYKDYKPQKWLPISNHSGEINLLKMEGLYSWYGESPKDDCILNFENFGEQPNKDGLALGYNGTKLAHYIHYQFVKETEELLKQAEEEVGALPDNVPSIIMFGLGVGYQLETLLDEHTVEKLFICEPNPDFFYASLFAIDWQAIFETVEKSESRIYLNIGDDGTNLFRDLLNQFYAIGPYILNSTYFYQSYYNASLNSAISQLREQLQVVISMGEYFDHAYYGIAHTTEGMKRKIPVLAANPASKLSYDDKEVPIFIVGNGPSLDGSIEAIKEWQGQAIIVSCGTALQALHRHGITPDFHAEIEQNRSTFDWAVLIGDLDYLKNITLISCNGIHPDTCDLYKDVLIAFKEGESSTISALNVLGRENFETLLNAFPTVSNFAVDLFSTIGFTSIYLIGVDLGFVDVKHHHSKSSGYYHEDGQETHDFAKSANTSLIVPGNFRSTVNTKHEFKVSRQVMEQVTSAKPKGQDFYNCSDGARIKGALPIRPDGLLIVATEQQKSQLIDNLKTRIFSDEKLGNYVEKFEVQYSQELLMEEISAFETLLEQEVTSKDDVERIINKQKEMLFESYKNGKSLLFYYLYGTVNYANAVLSKLLYSNIDSSKLSDALQNAKEKWSAAINIIKLSVLPSELDDFDTSHFNYVTRNEILWATRLKNRILVVQTDSLKFQKSIEHLISNRFPFFTIKTGKYDTAPDYIIRYFINPRNNLEQSNDIGIRGTLLVKELSSLDKVTAFSNQGNITLMPFFFGRDNTLNCEYYMASAALRALMAEHKCSLILPKHTIRNSFNIQALSPPVRLGDKISKIEFPNYIVLCDALKESVNLVGEGGTRGKVLLQNLKTKDLIFKQLDTQEFDETRRILVSFMS